MKTVKWLSLRLYKIFFRNNPLPINLMKREKENLKNKENSAGWMHFYSHLIQTPCVLYFSPVQVQVLQNRMNRTWFLGQKLISPFTNSSSRSPPLTAEQNSLEQSPNLSNMAAVQCSSSHNKMICIVVGGYCCYNTMGGFSNLENSDLLSIYPFVIHNQVSFCTPLFPVFSIQEIYLQHGFTGEPLETIFQIRHLEFLLSFTSRKYIC